MIILTPTIEEKLISVMPRQNDFAVFRLIDDSTNVAQEFVIIGYMDFDYYFQLTVDFDVELKENHYYDLILLNDNDVIIFKDRVFVTSQDIDTFSVNHNADNSPKYKVKSTPNEYLTYGG